MTDNPILDAALGSIAWAVGISLFIGMAIGVLATKLLGRRRPSSV
jgi:NhaP-type Na+/H+ or K+/H+ antiporter